MRYLKRVSTGNTELQQIIRDEIRRLGSISCERFIELALYHSRLGYYSQERLRIGRQGDFITNVSVGKLFGEILADQIVELWDILDRPPEFTIVESGAETADLASDLLNRLYQDRPSVPWNYVIAERSEAKQRQQRERLTGRSDKRELIPTGAVRWVNSLNDLAPITGIVLANELLDAIPVRVVEFSEDRWQEVRVVVENDAFKFISEPIIDPLLAAMIDKIPGPVPQPYRTEINLGALDWFRSAVGNLRRGFVLLIDYGYSRTDYYSPLRTEGTLTAYRNQRRQKNIFEEIGETDITAHVDFTAIAEAGLNGRLPVARFHGSASFLWWAPGKAGCDLLKGAIATRKDSNFCEPTKRSCIRR